MPRITSETKGKGSYTQMSKKWPPIGTVCLWRACSGELYKVTVMSEPRPSSDEEGRFEVDYIDRDDALYSQCRHGDDEEVYRYTLEGEEEGPSDDFCFFLKEGVNDK